MAAPRGVGDEFGRLWKVTARLGLGVGATPWMGEVASPGEADPAAAGEAPCPSSASTASAPAVVLTTGATPPPVWGMAEEEPAEAMELRLLRCCSRMALRDACRREASLDRRPV